MVKERADYQPVVLFTRENMDANKPPVRFIGGPKRQKITGSMQGAWDPERPVAVITTLGVLL